MTINALKKIQDNIFVLQLIRIDIRNEGILYNYASKYAYNAQQKCKFCSKCNKYMKDTLGKIQQPIDNFNKQKGETG